METAFPTIELRIFLPALNFCYILTQSPWKTSHFLTLADLYIVFDFWNISKKYITEK